MAETAPTKMVVSLAPAQQDFRAYNVNMKLIIVHLLRVVTTVHAVLGMVLLTVPVAKGGQEGCVSKMLMSVWSVHALAAARV